MVGIVSIIIFYVLYLSTGDGMGFGELNDAAVVVQYTLMLPIAVHLHSKLRVIEPRLSGISLAFGLIGMEGVIVLQLLLLAGVIPFSQRIGMVSAAFLIALIWFILNKRIARGTDIIPGSMTLNVLAGLLFGYPFWAYKFARSNRLSRVQQTSVTGV